MNHAIGNYKCLSEISLPHSNVRISHFEGKESVGNKVFITFTERTNRFIDGLGFGGNFLLNCGYDVITVKTDKDTWYTRLGDRGLSLICALAEFYTHRTTYGSSMGAFAAIKYAQILGSQHAIALSPIQDIRYNWDRRHHQDIDGCHFAHGSKTGDMITHEDISERCQYHIAYDPYCYEDRLHKDLLQSIIPAPRFMTIPLAGHPVGPTMMAAGILKEYVLACTEQRKYPVYQRDKKLTISNLYNLTHYLFMKGKFKQACVAGNRMIKNNDVPPEAFALYANILGELGELEKAEYFILRAVKHCPDNINMLGYACQIQIQLKKFNDAKIIIRYLQCKHAKDEITLNLTNFFNYENSNI